MNEHVCIIFIIILFLPQTQQYFFFKHPQTMKPELTEKYCAALADAE